MVEIHEHRKNLGKGASLRTGVEAFYKNDHDAVIFMDADHQHNPKYLGDFIKELKENSIVLGYRNLDSKSPFLRKLGNNIARFIFRTFFNIKRKDLLCGYMAFRKKAISQIKWRSNDYGVETEISAIIGKNKISFKEILIETIYIDRKKGVSLTDAFFIFLKIPFWYFRYETTNYLFIIILFASAMMFLLLAFKNPFKPSSLIGNLEPFPDVLYYAVPAWNFVNTGRFAMEFDHVILRPVTPPLFSIVLIPFFFLFKDVRVFYFTNIVLMLGSITIFFTLLKKLFSTKALDTFIVIFIMFLFVTNFYIYTIPGFMLAENLTLFLLILSFHLLWTKETRLTSSTAGLLGVSFWLVKFSNLTFGIVFYLLYFLKLIKSKKHVKSFLAIFVFSLIFFALYMKSSNILADHKNLQPGASFGLLYFKRNFDFYINVLKGGSIDFLWFREKMLSPIVSLLLPVGLIAGLLVKEYRIRITQIIMQIITLIVFMSFFYATDIRFIFALYPLILLAAAIGLYQLKNLIGTKRVMILTSLLFILYILVPGLAQKKSERFILTLKKQVALNFRHSETPWYYVSVQEFNSFFSDKEYKGSYLGSFLPPFFINFYSNGMYHYLPISINQDFFSEKDSLAKKKHISNVSEYYLKLLQNRNRVFISNIYVNNFRPWQADLDLMNEKFEVSLMKEGCYRTCNIYELHLKR